MADSTSGRLSYRPDIDGLRAVAVVPIVLLHAGAAWLPGGFAGVDVFFVISGFLLTAIIVGDLERGRFSFAAFYRRRAVRILPALLVLVAAVQVAGRLLLLPQELGTLGASSIATLGFAANVYFWQRTGYFAPAVDTFPLLHTWSLGAEEQFYILYPLLLLLAWKLLRKNVVALLAVVTAASLAFAAVAAWVWPEAAFYLLPSRAWELGLGGLVALGVMPSIASPRLRAGLALGGAALLATSFLLLEASQWFPFPLALVPCLGTVLLLAYGASGPTSLVLAAAPLRAIGLISYSLYLWHWPIIAFYLLETGPTLAPGETIGLVAVSCLAALASFLLVERPFRTRFRDAPPRRVLVAACVAVAALLALSGAAYLYRDTWRAASPEVLQIAAYSRYQDWPQARYQFRDGPCFPSRDYPVAFDPVQCLPLDDRRPNVLVLGDSHGAQLWRALSESHPRLNVIQATASGCRPVVGATGEERCLAMLRYVYGRLLRSGRIDTVVLAARWMEPELDKVGPTIALWRARGAQVLVLGPTVEYRGTVPAMLARARLHGDLDAVLAYRDLDRAHLDRLMATAATKAGARYLSLQQILCPQGRCRLFAPDGAPMQFDYGHFTLSGSRWVARQIPLDGPAMAAR